MKQTTQDRFAEELGPLFAAWADPEGHACVRESLLEAGPEETARQLYAAEALLEGLAKGASVGIGDLAGSFVTDAARRVEAAWEIAEAHARAAQH